MHRFACLVAMLAVVAPAGAAAQTAAPLELFGGYAFAYDANNDASLPIGWLAGTSFPMGTWLGIVADVGVNAKRVDAFGADVRVSTLSVTGGPRASGRIGPFTESAQLVAGMARSSATAFGVTETSYAFALQPGVSIDCPLGARAAFRSQLDARFIGSGPDGNEGGYQLRLSAQIVYRVR